MDSSSTGACTAPAGLLVLLVMLAALLVMLLVMLALLVHALSPPPPPPALLLQLWVAGRVAVAAVAAAAAAQEAVSSESSAAPCAADASTSCGLVVRLVRVLVFEEASESTPEESKQRLRCQYLLYFCTRKASKLSTWPARLRRGLRIHP